MYASDELQSVRSNVFDRGLADWTVPDIPFGNPALLSEQDDIQCFFGFYNRPVHPFGISLSSPVSSKTGLSLSWFSMHQNNIHNLTEGIFETGFNKQVFYLNLGHQAPVRWGQQLEIDFEWNRYSVIQINDPETIPFINDESLTLQYRVGYHRQIGKLWHFGILSPPFVYWHSKTYIALDKFSESNIGFVKEVNSQSSMPRVGIIFHPKSWLRMALSNRSQSGTDDIQLAGEWMSSVCSICGAIRKSEKDASVQTALGAGGEFKGFHCFASYDFNQKSVGVAISFRPLLSKELIRIQEFEPTSIILYPYRLRHGVPDYLAMLSVENLSEESVELKIDLEYSQHSKTCLSTSLPGLQRSVLHIPLPDEIEQQPAGHRLYIIKLVAFQRGRQTIERDLGIELQDSHDWSGNPEDLIYFVETDDNLLKRSRQILTSMTKEPVAIAKAFYQFVRDSIRYVNDPNPLSQRQDRIQYPDELLHTRSGDCEDLSVLFASLLQGNGIDADFVEYLSPSTEEGHVFILFDSGYTVADIINQDGNVQNFVIRRHESQSPECYIPLEVSRKDLPFEDAWHHALDVYYELGIRQHGLANGWFNIIDVN